VKDRASAGGGTNRESGVIWSCNVGSGEEAGTHLQVLQAVLCSDDSEHILLAALLHLSGDQQFVEDEVGLLEVEDDVQLANIAVVFVHLLDIAVDDFESDQLIVGIVGSGDEEERGIAAVHDFGVCGGTVSKSGSACEVAEHKRVLVWASKLVGDQGKG
jgi:hypothetical protein